MIFTDLTLTLEEQSQAWPPDLAWMGMNLCQEEDDQEDIFRKALIPVIFLDLTLTLEEQSQA